MRYLLLGPLEFRQDGKPLRLGGSRQRKLLAALLLAANQVVPVTRLVDVIWDDRPPASAVKQVRNRISSAKSAFHQAGLPDPITNTGGGYRFALDEHDLDVALFRGCLDRASQQARSGNAGAAVRQFRDALSLWRGPALAGLDCPLLTGAAAYLDEQRAAAIEQLAELELQLGNHGRLVGELIEITAEYPLRERLVGYLMLALCRCDRRADALATYRHLRARLREELGIEPAHHVRQLHEQILARPGHPVALVARPTVREDFVERKGRGDACFPDLAWQAGIGGGVRLGGSAAHRGAAHRGADHVAGHGAGGRLG
jgi:DNA-binding SARP family transcriptional activator